MAAHRLPPWSWHGVVAVILAVSIGGSYAVVLVITALQHGPVTDAGASLLNNLGAMLAGALAGWLGGSAVSAARAQQHQDDKDDADTGPYVEPDAGRDSESN